VGSAQGRVDAVKDAAFADERQLGSLLQRLAPQVLGTLVRRYGQFDACEDAVQEALVDATVQWRAEGTPANPRAWLLTVASRRLIDHQRSERARRLREDAAATQEPVDDPLATAPDDESADPEEDDTLTLLVMCCHPSLTAASQIALTLRAVGGLSTAEIASAFFVPEATMAQRISRAKQTIKTNGGTFDMPSASDRPARLRVVLHVLYLIFNEGYTSTAGRELSRQDLTKEAIRLTRTVHDLLPRDGEVTGLLALMLLTEARRAARTTADGSLVPLAEQDRAVWDPRLIEEGTSLIAAALATGPVGPYQLQAAIAAVHAEAQSAHETDWRQILSLYELLERFGPNPMVTLNRAVAVAMVNGPSAALELLDKVSADERIARSHRLDAVRGHLHEMAGNTAAAVANYRSAARRTTSLPERRYLERQAASVEEP
jgi:RNA polymerase sigma factor (sigma-70 family)